MTIVPDQGCRYSRGGLGGDEPPFLTLAGPNLFVVGCVAVHDETSLGNHVVLAMLVHVTTT